MNIKSTLMGAAASIAMIAGGTAAVADGHGEITVGYFLEWPMPFQFAKVQGSYDEALGAKVNYSENDNCVVASGLEIDKDSAGELAGKKVAVPLGTAAHYGFLRQMDHFGVDVAGLSVVDMAPAEGAAALAQGQVDMSCGWGGALRTMKEHGNVLLTGAEKEALGILVFDATTAPASYIAENPEMVAKFLAVTAEANAMWAAGDMKDEMLAAISADAGMDPAATEETLAGFVFPTIDQQLSEAWLGGNAQTFMKGVAQVFVDSGSIPSALDSYEGAVNTGPLGALN